MWFPVLWIFARLFWRARETLVKRPPGIRFTGPFNPNAMFVLTHLPLVPHIHYSDVMVGTMASQITSVSIVWPIVCSGEDQKSHQSSASLAFVRGIRRSPVNSPHKEPVTWKMLPFDDVSMYASVNRVGIGSENGLSPIRCQAIILTNAGILSIGPLGTYFSEISI